MSGSLGNKNKKASGEKGKGKEQVEDSLNVLIVDVPELSTFSSQSIKFSCYIKREVVEWLLDSSCTEHVTPVKSNLHMYKEFNPPRKAEITDGKFITIEGWGTVLGH